MTLEFHLKYLALFCIFSEIKSFSWFWMETLNKNIQMILEFLEASLLIIHFSYYTFMAFLMKQSLILLYLLVMPTTLSVIRHLICCIKQNWSLNYNMIYETLWTEVGCGFLTSKLEKFSWFHCVITLVLLK